MSMTAYPFIVTKEITCPVVRININDNIEVRRNTTKNREKS
eukprot:CAMPEP_0170813158 /NCGR_PEP_ID=MMETSP0733-20121128/36604_1 /TAXON_ID=186038 /ORGANISM="Fragilariopsis kerguelensis, Strain L26-C5" /LENGTH=40 /DNA_ID= /DNA_START= /DNA_END= /DNA_ORIENTATION=